MSKLKTILNKLNLNPELTDELLNIDVGDVTVSGYHKEKLNGNEFLVLHAGSKSLYTEIIVDSTNQTVSIYTYSEGKTPSEDIPDMQTAYDRNGNVILL